MARAKEQFLLLITLIAIVYCDCSLGSAADSGAARSRTEPIAAVRVVAGRETIPYSDVT